MILDEYVDVRVNSYTIKYYEEKGYKIPKRIGSHRKEVYALGETFSVSVNDLPDKSHELINAECNVCHKKVVLPYSKYTSSVSNYGYYSCVDCMPKKVSMTKKNYSEERKKEMVDKLVKTCNEKYGDYSPGHDPHSDKKRRKTLFEHYGVEVPTKSMEILERAKNTNIERYGVPYIMQVPEFKERSRTAVIEKYGVFNIITLPEIREKIKNTSLKKYGVESPVQSLIVREKIAQSLRGEKQTLSKQQKYLWRLFGGELNYPFKSYNLDIAFVEQKIDIEYDGSGHDLSVKYKTESKESFVERAIIRSSYLKQEGWNIMRIISFKDNLPSDTILLEMLNFARQFFADNPERSWIEFDIDNNIYRNALHKDGEPYDFGPLRKIKQDNIETKALS